MKSGTMRIRTAFRLWVIVAAVIAFAVAATVSFVLIRVGERQRAEASMKSEVNYLCLQLESQGERADAFVRVVGEDDATHNRSEDYRLLSNRVGDVLDGYTMAETGTVAILQDGAILDTDDPRLIKGRQVSTLLGEDVAAAIEASLEAGEIRRIDYDGILATRDEVNGQDYAVQEGYLIASRYEDFTVMIIEPESMFYKDLGMSMISLTGLFLLLLVVMVILVSRLLNYLVAKPIDETNEALSSIVAGNLETKVESGETREFESLSDGINQTVDALRGWIAEAESRMDAELATAKTIQEAALPRTFPPFPEIPKFDVFACMNAAREVGGDFYDFFLVGDDCGPEAGKLGFVVADVSGKGVPAALFMMKAKALIRDYVMSGLELGEAVAEVNRQLVEGNDENMFVTAWVGVLDYASGHIDYVNAGHNPPLLRQGEGGWQWLRKKSGPMLGVFDMPYRTQTLECTEGDMLLLYTDGVTEAFDVNEELFGEERLLTAVETGESQNPRELVDAVLAGVAAYVGEAERSDDITMLALEVGVPAEASEALEVPAVIDELTTVNDFLHAELDQRFCPQRVQYKLDVAVEELFTNVCSYAYPDATPDYPGTVWVRRTYTADPSSITVDFIDAGEPFNPLERPCAETPASIEDAPIGGLGIMLARQCVDEMRYAFVDGKNVVTIVKRW